MSDEIERLCSRTQKLAGYGNHANALVADVRAAFASLQAERDEALDRIDVLARRHEEDEAYRVKANEERDAALARVEALTKLLTSVVAEADFVLSGGDDEHDACTECGLAGVGMLRDALNPARVVVVAARAAPAHRRALGGKADGGEGGKTGP